MDAVVRKGLAEYFQSCVWFFVRLFCRDPSWSSFLKITFHEAQIWHTHVGWLTSGPKIKVYIRLVWLYEFWKESTSTYLFTSAIFGDWRRPVSCWVLADSGLDWSLACRGIEEVGGTKRGSGSSSERWGQHERRRCSKDEKRFSNFWIISWSRRRAGVLPWDFCERNRPGNYVTGRYYVDPSTFYVAGYIWLSHPKFHAKGRTWEIDATPEITHSDPRAGKATKRANYSWICYTETSTDPGNHKSQHHEEASCWNSASPRSAMTSCIRSGLTCKKARLSLSVLRSPVTEHVEKEQGHLGSTKRSLWSSGHESGGGESLISRKICYPKSQVKMIMMLHAMNWVRHYQHARIVLPCSNWNTALSNTGTKTAGISSTQIIK